MKKNTNFRDRLIKFNRRVFLPLVVFSYVLLCTSCLSFLFGDMDSDAPQRSSLVLQFAPDTSDAKNANMPGIDATDVSVSVESNTGEIVAEEFFKAGSRSSITVRVPRNKSLKVKVSFSGNHGMWEGEINRTITDSYIKAIVKMRKVSDAATASTNPEPKKSATTTTQTKQKTDREPVYFSTVTASKYKFNNAKNDLKTARFKFFWQPEYQYYIDPSDHNEPNYVQKAVFCRDNDSNLYVLSDEETLKLYNSNGELIDIGQNFMPETIYDLTCDPITNKIYGMNVWQAAAGETGVEIIYAILKIEKDFSNEIVANNSLKIIFEEEDEDYNIEEYPNFVAAYNGMAVCFSRADPIFKKAYYVDLNSNNPKFKTIEFPANYEFRGADWPESVVKDVFMDDKHIYVLTIFQDGKPDEGQLIVYDYKVIGSNGNRKIKVECDIANMKIYGGYPGGGNNTGYYNKNFAVPVKFVGYQNGFLYIADDGIEENGDKDINRIVTFDIKNNTLKFKDLSSVIWIE